MAARSGAARDGGPFAALAPDEGRAALAAVLRSGTPAHVAVAKVRWPELARATSRLPRWLSSLVDGAPGERAPSALPAQLGAVPPAARHQRIAALPRDELRAALGLPADEPIAGDADLASFGVDSLVAIQVPQLLSDRLGVPLPSTLVSERRTLDALTAALV